MFNCIYDDGTVETVEDPYACPFKLDAELLDVAEISTTVEVTTAAPGANPFLIGAGITIGILLLARRSRRS